MYEDNWLNAAADYYTANRIGVRTGLTFLVFLKLVTELRDSGMKTDQYFTFAIIA
ncbi:hypothetical protein [Paenibacillus sp. MMO-58]|uniref:hypothetical protein n=1 Tax=Paenibacillus sp. MMO-58 TaxID=3081290 RepID=UPI003019DB7D